MLTINQTMIETLVGDLHTALARVKHAISKQETRYYLNGVYLHNHQGRLALVATDGHRLARMLIHAEGVENMIPVILPLEFVCTILKTSKKNRHQTAKLTISPLSVSFTCNGETFECKPIDGTFPDYQRVIPSGEPKFKTPLLLEPFHKAVSAIHCYRGDGVVKLTFTDKQLIVSGQPLDSNVSFTTAKAMIEIEERKEPVQAVGYNGRYLLDMMKSIESDGYMGVIFSFYDALGPNVFTTGTDTDLYVLMPMRI